MKKYKLTLQVNGESFEPRSVDVIESDELLALLSQLPFIIRKISEQEIEYHKRHAGDDIPF